MKCKNIYYVIRVLDFFKYMKLLRIAEAYKVLFLDEELRSKAEPTIRRFR